MRATRRERCYACAEARRDEKEIYEKILRNREGANEQLFPPISARIATARAVSLSRPRKRRIDPARVSTRDSSGSVARRNRSGSEELKFDRELFI